VCEGCSCVALTFILLLVIGFFIFFNHAYVGYGHMLKVFVFLFFLFFCFSMGFSLLFSYMYVGYHYMLRFFSLFF